MYTKMWRLGLWTIACPSITMALVLLTPPASHYAVYDWKRTELFDFYREFFLATQAAGEPVILVVTGKPHFLGLDDGSRAVLGRMGVPDSTMLSFELDDIWVRDFFPTQISSNVIAEFGYAPAYLDIASVQFINSATQKLLRFVDLPGLTPIGLTGDQETVADLLVMDGGGIIVEPATAWAVVTERVLRDNPSLVGRGNLSGLGPADTCCPADPYRILSDDTYGRFTPTEISMAKTRLKSLLGMNEVAIIPEEPEVPRLGHVDGIANWLAPGVLALSNFSDTAVYKSYVNILQDTFGPNLTVVPFPYAVTTETDRDGFESATGIYVNFLRTREAMYLPIFDIPDDSTALTIAREFGDQCESDFYHGRQRPLPFAALLGCERRRPNYNCCTSKRT